MVCHIEMLRLYGMQSYKIVFFMSCGSVGMGTFIARLYFFGIILSIFI